MFYIYIDGLSNSGSNFYLGFLRQRSSNNKVEMIVLTEVSSPIQFNISSSTGYSYIGTTTANAATFVSIPSSLQVRESSYTYRHLGLHVTSSPSQPISVVMIGYTSTPRSTYLALPCHDQPTEEYIYYGISHKSSENNRYSQILIVGCRDNTTVTITPTQTIQLPQDPQQSNSAIVTITAGTSHTVTIHALQTLLIAAELVDLTGTKVVSNYPLTVIGGHDCTTVPVSYLDCDPIATQSSPTINWGTQFLLIPLQSRSNGQMVKVMSSENGTNVVIRCSDQSLHSNLAFAGNFISYYVGSLHYCHILCSQPCYVAEFAFGREYNSYIGEGYGDPLIMTVPSIRQYIHSVTFTTLPEMPTNFFGIVVPADSYFNGTVLINDVLTTYDWTIIYNINGTISGYGYTTTANGNYTISHSHPNGKIYVSVYGFSHYGGYGYSAGMLLDLLAVSKNSTQHVNRSSMLFIDQTSCLPMTQSTTVITITTTTNQMTPIPMYHVTSDTTPKYSTLTVKDTCTETITTTTVTTGIVGSPLSCNYSTVLAQTSTITVYSEPSSFTNVPVTTGTCPSIAPYSTSKITPCECSSTSVASSVTSYVIKSTSCTSATSDCVCSTAASDSYDSYNAMSSSYTVTVTHTDTTMLTNTITASPNMPICQTSTVFIPVSSNTRCPDIIPSTATSTTVGTDKNNSSCVTSSIFPAITTIDYKNKQTSITRATVITKGKGILTSPQTCISTTNTINNIIILRPTNKLQTETASSIINIGSNIGLAMTLLISIIVCIVMSILSYKAGVSRGKKQANDGYEKISITNPHYHPEPDINSNYENSIQNTSNDQDLHSEEDINSISEDNHQHVYEIAEPTPIENTLPSQHQQNSNFPLTEEEQPIASQMVEKPVVSPQYENLPMIIINQNAGYLTTERSLLGVSTGETSSIYSDTESNDISSRFRSCIVM